ncbi:MAG: class I SAM-dependent methyltransferase [Tepidisphaeraceae bacterium]
MSDLDNVIIPEWHANAAIVRLFQHRLARMGRPIVAIGTSAELQNLNELESRSGLRVRRVEWDFGQSVPQLEEDESLLLLRPPVQESHWQEIQQIRRNLGRRFVGMNEVVLPINNLHVALYKLPYSVPDIAKLAAYYCGDAIFGSLLDKLEAVFPLRGRSVIEFGPLDGFQTAYLVNQGASRVLCVEARAENTLKVMAAKAALGWNAVEVRMDDFHNVDVNSCGRFDLAFAHGVYYHSIAPFVFLDNLVSLADNIYLGGFCATDENPLSPYLTLRHNGEDYRVKRYTEGGRDDFYAGVNTFAYFFHGDDLVKYFESAGFRVDILEDMTFDASQCSGRYLRFFAKRV